MNTLSVDVSMLIVEYACSDDFGQTARRLGLVSKSYRSIAEPIELRTIAVSGLSQLHGAILRLEKARLSRVPDESTMLSISVRHLFISELTKEHALAADTRFEMERSRERSSFWKTEEGRKVAGCYGAYAEDFWMLASHLVRATSGSLKTLFLLSTDNWFSWRGATHPSGDKSSRKVLGALSGLAFPRLISLTVNHNVALEYQRFDEHFSSFRSPALPSLRRLHVISQVYMDKYRREGRPKLIHPLLASSRSGCQQLTELILRFNELELAEHVLRAVFGENWTSLLSDKKFPGTLQYVRFAHGIWPVMECGNGIDEYEDELQAFEDVMMNLQISRLEVQSPMSAFPNVGEREFELLLAEWKEQSF